jgi:hypothetical protein
MAQYFEFPKLGKRRDFVAQQFGWNLIADIFGNVGPKQRASPGRSALEKKRRGSCSRGAAILRWF